jgi:hypothetical protein
VPRTVEGIVEAHQAARERRTAGRPIWDRRIHLADVWRDEERSFQERRDEVVRRLRASGWVEKNEEVAELVEELAEVDTLAYFDDVWDGLYDLADTDRVWISTF